MTYLAACDRTRGVALRPGRIATVTAILFVGLSASRAEASCGDWLAGHGPTPASAHDHDGPVPTVPCDGPECRRSRQDLPLIPSGPSRQLEGPERWCRLADEAAARPSFSSALTPEAEPATADGYRPSIDRPPRV